MAITALPRESVIHQQGKHLLTAAVLVGIAPFLLIGAIFLLEVCAGLPRNGSASESASLPPSALVIPAHDEEQVLGATLSALQNQVPDRCSILVVADNCSDGTAGLARHAGVSVIERHNSVLRGKGFALDFARAHLSECPPEVVVILDSDCRTDRGSLAALIMQAHQQQHPTQAINLLQPDRTAGTMVQVSTFAFLLKNLVRQRGLQRLTGGVHLTGTGMALPWALFAKADLATASIVEDVRLGIELSRQGAAPQLVSAARVWSPHAAQTQTLTQRSRWEGGFLSLAKALAPKLLVESLTSLSVRQALSALDLMIPPVALLIGMYIALLGMTGLLALTGVTSLLPVLLIAGVLGLMAISIGLVWLTEGRDYLSGAALLRAPAYIFWKLPMYFSLLRGGAPKVWARTERSEQKDREAS